MMRPMITRTAFPPGSWSRQQVSPSDFAAACLAELTSLDLTMKDTLIQPELDPEHVEVPELAAAADLEAANLEAPELLRCLRPRNGVSKADLHELVLWLGPQAFCLTAEIRLVELFAGHKANLSRVARHRGHGVLSLGLSYGQDLSTRKARRMIQMIINYSAPEDIFVAWECKYWSQLTYVNESNPVAKENIERGRAKSYKQILLFFAVWFAQLAGGRHCSGENPYGSRAWQLKQFHEQRFLDTAYFQACDQCGYDCNPPWCLDRSEVHQKRTLLVSTRNSIHDVNFHCSKEHRQALKHVPLEGAYGGRNLTSWAEDYSMKFATAICDALGIVDIGDQHFPKDEIFVTTGNTDSVEDPALVAFLNALAEGRHYVNDLGEEELDILSVFTGLEVTEICVKDNATLYLNPSRTSSRRCTLANVNGQWIDAEGAVRLDSVPRGALMRPPADRAVAVFGEPLFRLRARTFPSGGNEKEALAWLKKFHIGTAHSSPAEMAQAIKDAGGSAMLQRMALQFQCAICDVDKLDRARHRSALPLHARSFNMILLIDVVDIELERIESPVIKVNLLFAADAWSSFALAWMLDSFTAEHLAETLIKGWFAIFGAPRKVFSDNAVAFVSKHFTERLGRWGTLLTTSAVAAPWQHGRLDRLIQRRRHCIRALWKTFARWPEALPEEIVTQSMTAGNELSMLDSGVSPYQLVFGSNPRRFLGDIEGQDFDLTLASLDRSSEFLDGMAKRAIARSTWIRSDTIARIDRAVLSKPAKVVPLVPNELVQFFREVVRQGGRRVGVWKGPATVICCQSDRDGLVPSKVYVAYQGRPWICAPEGVRPISVEAHLARRTLSEAEPLRRHLRQHGQLRGIDIRHEIRSLGRVPAAADEMDTTDEARPDEQEIADLLAQVRSQEEAPVHVDLPANDPVEENDEADIDELMEDLFPENRLRRAAAEANETLDLGAERAKRLRRHDDGAEENYHVQAEFFNTPDHPYDQRGYEIAFICDLDEIADKPFAINQILESCMLNSIARKRSLEVKLKNLNGREKLGFRAAKRKECAQWLSNKVLDCLQQHGLPRARAVRCRWVLTFKSDTGVKGPQVEKPDAIEDADVKESFSVLPDGRVCKARVVILGYEDPELGEHATYAPTIRMDSKAMIFSIAAHRKYKIRGLDIKTAFLNGKSSVRARPLHVILPADFEHFLHRVAKAPFGPKGLLKAAYGLGEAPLEFFLVLIEESLTVGFYQMSSDRCLLVLRGVAPGGRLPPHYPKDYNSLPILGIVGVHVDDLLTAGDGPEFAQALDALAKVLPFGGDQAWDFVYCGEHVKQHPETFEVTLDQAEKLENLQEIDLKMAPKATPLEPQWISKGKAVVGSLLYVATNTRPDLSFGVSYCGSKNKEGLLREDLMELNKVVRFGKNTIQRKLRFIKLESDWKDVIIACFSDAGWATRPTGHSQAGGLLFLASKNLLDGDVAKCNLMDWICSKITWIVKNSHDAEGHACSSNLENGEYLQFFMCELGSWTPRTIEHFLFGGPEIRVTLAIVIDNKGLYTQVDLNKLDKRHTIYIQYLFQLVRATRALLFWVHGGHQLADPLTKLKPDNATDEALAEVLQLNRVKIAYDTESFKKALKKGRKRLERLIPWEPPADQDVEWDLEPKGLRRTAAGV